MHFKLDKLEYFVVENTGWSSGSSWFSTHCRYPTLRAAKAAAQLFMQQASVTTRFRIVHVKQTKNTTTKNYYEVSNDYTH